ncbi:class I SAM-dependent methyltransferase [candidate division CSSED10-310 bacterium]|uniref:Class I SAM-dependent methyltransferase n=1 Tax=candidate division CSSED10-310 bacterium TaxID=2855610 RepID=A0ABV6Z4W1_UNCC1
MLNHFDILAPYYDRFIGSPEPRRLKKLLQLPVSGRLLDAGGGTGRISEHLRSQVGQLVICDLSLKMLTQARHLKALSAIQAHTEQLPFPEESFERIVVVDAFHHFCDQKLALHELLRVLKPGGRLVIEEPDKKKFVVKLVALAEKLAFMKSQFYSPEEIRAMVISPGLSTTIIRTGGFAAWVVVEKKISS